MSTYAYPPDAATALLQHWPAHAFPLPAHEVLTQLLAVAYQASLLQEESRPVVGHLMLAPEQRLTDPLRRSDSFQVLRFARPLPYHEQELRRLSPTVQRAGHLLAVEDQPGRGLVIWGLVVAARPWDYAHEPTATDYLAPTLFIHLFGSGNLGLFCGAERILVLQHGRLIGSGQLHFPRAWVSGHFQELASLRTELALPEAGVELVQALTRYLTHRLLAQVQAGGHGGMIVLLGSAQVANRVGPDGLLVPKYGVQPNETGTRALSLARRAVARSLELGLTNWVDYRLSTDGLLQSLHTELTHFADLLATFMTVDGALVLSQQFELIGFGVEVRAPALPTKYVYHALDAEATTLHAEAADSSGTRHRAAYRLCQAEPDCLVIVVSQDGGVEFVRNQAGQVIFWNQLPV